VRSLPRPGGVPLVIAWSIPTGLLPTAARPSRAVPSKIRPGWAPVREAVAITEQIKDTSSEGTGEGEVEAAGHFRIYLGAAPGVGKTYAMLSEGQRRRGRGADVVAGFVETYGRPLTEALINGLEVIPRKVVDYRGIRLEEMDLAAVLRRQPNTALVDELAHTNVPGSGPHDKRWRDVLDILGAGINVITTVNIQHIESIADEVEQMTGVKVGERVPDWVVRQADQVELVDSSPEQLRRRMLHGNIYPKEKIARALTHFFRTDNLIALRELALRFVADESDEELLERLRPHPPAVPWETTERIMAVITATPGTDVLLRRAARLALRVKGGLDVVHVNVGEAGPAMDTRTVDELRELAVALGARWHELEDDDPAQAVVGFARQHQITQIVIGSTQHSWWYIADGGRIVRRVIHEASACGIDVLLIARRGVPGARC
jgi:two-component system, OmpR family, sensor histidine kinase KdpD